MSAAPARFAVVTGGSSGIGAAICAALAGERYRVFNADIAPPDTPDHPATFVECDIRGDASVAALFAQVGAAAGRLDVLVNNAGVAASPRGIAEIDSVAWDDSLAILLGAPRRMMTAAIPLLRAGGGGSIINIASICGIQPGWGGMAYSVAKGALIHLTRIAAAELAREDIRVNAISPGFIGTPIFGRTRGLDRAQSLELAQVLREEAGAAQPLPRAGRPEDIAAAVCFLASASGAFVTGQNLCVDGGLSLAPAHVWDEESSSPVLRAIAAGQRRVSG